MTETLQDIYADIPHLPCRGFCAKSCGSIYMPPNEYNLIVAEVGPIPAYPMLAPATGLPVVRFRADGKGRCPKLRAGRCTIYERRPLVCRLWGVLEAVPCPYGCQPDRYLDANEARDLFVRVAAVAPTDGR